MQTSSLYPRPILNYTAPLALFSLLLVSLVVSGWGGHPSWKQPRENLAIEGGSSASVSVLQQLNARGKDASVRVAVNLSAVVAQVDERFVSVAFDSGGIIKHWRHINLISKRLRALMSALTPAYLRVGGNAADFLIFREKGRAQITEVGGEGGRSFEEEGGQWLREELGGPFERKNLSTFYMSGADFDVVNKFALQCGARLIFDLNVLLREGGGEGRWNSTNAEELLAYAQRRDFAHNLHFELGNEPNAFLGAYNRNLSAKQLARDYSTLRRILSSPLKGAAGAAPPGTLAPFNHSLLMGPAVTQPQKKALRYLSKFLKSGGAGQINATTFHHYYMDGRTAILDDLISPPTLDSFSQELSTLRNVLRGAGWGARPVWLGETATCWGGGAPGLSDRYVAGFMWLDKLGVAASNGVKVVVRQALIGGHYELITEQLLPNPDYWLTWIFKLLVGQKVFNVSMADDERKVRMYAHCTNTQRSGYPLGAVTLYGMNLGQDAVNVTLDSALMPLVKQQYWLLPYGPDGLKSKKLSLSGVLLQLGPDSSLPHLHPVTVPPHAPITLPPLSFGFIVVPGARVLPCL